MGTGPPGVGVLHTSGKAMDWPLEPLWTMPRKLQKVVWPMGDPFLRDGDRQGGAGRTVIRAIDQRRLGSVAIGNAVGGQRDQQGSGRRTDVAIAIGGMKDFGVGIDE